MLVEIQCDKFMKQGMPRGPITFHPGLNVVIGDDNGTNSLGKSTFLLILDFVFGGQDYIDKCKDVHNNIGEHVINFTFVFESEPYHFSRSTVDYQHVTLCDQYYRPLQVDNRMTVDEYTAFLAEKYRTKLEDDQTWRNTVSPFIRVWLRDTIKNAEQPLHVAEREDVASEIKRYMQLYGRYQLVAEQARLAKNAESEKSAFTKSLSFKHIRAASGPAEYQANLDNIEELKIKEHELRENSNNGLEDLDSFQAVHLAELKEQMARYKRQRAEVQKQLNTIRREMSDGKRSFKKNYSELERFFPGIEFQELEKIERFHQKLAKVLRDEFKETEQNLATTYVMLENEIARIREEMDGIKKVPNVSEAILMEYAQIITELNGLTEANSNYDLLEKLKADASRYAETRDQAFAIQLQTIEDLVNPRMKTIAERVYVNQRYKAPVLRLEKRNKYILQTPDDNGTGAHYRGVIIFDLANMELSPLPFVIHDMQMLLDIQRDVVAEIIKEYTKLEGLGKQAFVAYDRLDAYDIGTIDAMNENCVLYLSPGGNELFGRAWNQDTESTDGK